MKENPVDANLKNQLSALDILGQDTINEFKRKHGQISELIIEADELGNDIGMLVVVHKPTRSAFARFLRDSQTNAFNAMQAMMLDCTLYPSTEVLRQAFTDEPGLVVTFGNKLAALAKANLECLQKHL